MLKFSTFCRPVFQKKVIVKGSSDAGEGTGKRTTPAEIHRTFVKSDWEMGGGGRLHSFIWRLRLKKSKTIQFFISFWEMFCPFLAIVGKITPGAQLAGNQTFQIHWLRTLHLNRFLKQLLNTVFVEIVSGKFMSLYTYMQALITCTIIHSNNFSLALLTP